MTTTLIIAVDDPHIRYLLQRYAEESGCYATGVCGGAEALALLAEPDPPALIILDTDLHDRSGDQIRTAACARHVPIVLYSCLDELTHNPPSGVTGCLPRSVMYDDFVAELQRAGLRAGTALRR